METVEAIMEFPGQVPAQSTEKLDKVSAIDALVSSLDAFDAATPVTDFPEKMADKAKAARSLAAELKDDLLMMKQQLSEMKDDLNKLSDPGHQERFASMFVNRLDVVANALQDAGEHGLAERLDVVANTLLG